jgi:hypothetical protein
MKKKKDGYVNPKPLKQPLPTILFVIISLGGLLLGAAMLVFYILFAPRLAAQGIDKTVYYVLLIPFGLCAAAFLFGAMRSFARYKGKVLGGKLEITGPAVVFFLVIILGFTLPPEPKPFDFTIFVRDGAGKTVLKDEGSIQITLDNDPRKERIDRFGAADFKGIPPKFMNREIPVELIVKGWRFAAGKISTNIKLTGNSGTLAIERDDSLARLTGTVTDGRGNFIAGARIVIEDLVTITDQNGWFKLEIPPDRQKEKQLLSVQKDGYQSYMDYTYPANPTRLVIVLKK